MRRPGIRIWHGQEVCRGAGLLLALHRSYLGRRRRDSDARSPLVQITILSQVINGVVLPFVLIFMLLLANKTDLMGEYVNSRVFNIIAWATTVIMVGLTVAWFLVLKSGGS